MDMERVYELVEEFSQQPHGYSSHSKERIFVKGRGANNYAPFKFLTKKINDLKSVNQLLQGGMIYNSLGPFHDDQFIRWFQHQFSKKLTSKRGRTISLLHKPNAKTIFSCIEQIHKSYDILRQEQIILNGKNLPVQVGEWYAKCIFGLDQRKSTSQRGFDFFLKDKKIEVKVHWPEQISHKGVKLKKSLVGLSDYVMVIYLAKDLKIQEICLLDSDFIVRKFSSKGHTIFLKDENISSYFFSQSSKHAHKVVNCSFLVRSSCPKFAMNISDYFQNNNDVQRI